MIEGNFLPNSPTLMNAGKGNGLQYSACYVLPVGDSMEEIFDSVKAAAIIHKSGGGTGFAFSRLRPKDDIVASTGGRASGPVSFLKVFNSATEAVKQGGTRRGANMGILRVDHPDILEFIDCKLDGGITNFNISVAATDRFMDALASGSEYELINPHSGEVTGRLLAKEVFDRIVRAAWRTGDPGMVFIDRINASPANPTPAIGVVEATNPCGEQPLLPNEACNLGSLNVSKFARRSDAGEWSVDWDEMERVVRLAVRFLDDVIEMNPYPLPVIDETVKANRRIGLGIMGWADLLFTMGIPYDSQDAIELADRLMAFVKEKSHDQSAKLAEERGTFTNWDRSIYRAQRPMRNSTVTTIAPTGTISMIAGCSSGVEPIFALAFEHRVKQSDGERVLTFVNETFERIAREQGFYSDALMQEIAKRGSLHGIRGLPEHAAQVFRTSHEIGFEWHVRHQAAFQRSTDNGVSKTINLPNNATRRGRGACLPPCVGAGLPGHHGVPRRVQGRAGAQHRRLGEEREEPRGRRPDGPAGHQAAPAWPQGLDLPDADTDRNGLDHHHRDRRARAVRGLRPGRQGRLGHDGGRGIAGTADFAHSQAAFAALGSAQARRGHQPARAHRRRPAYRLRSRQDSLVAGRAIADSRRAHRRGEAGWSRLRRPQPRASRSATCARSAARRRSSTRKAARSACRAASTSAEQRSRRRGRSPAPPVLESPLCFRAGPTRKSLAGSGIF